MTAKMTHVNIAASQHLPKQYQELTSLENNQRDLALLDEIFDGDQS